MSDDGLGLQFRCGPFMLANIFGCESTGCGTVGKIYQIIADNKTDVGENLADISAKLDSEYIITSIFKILTKYLHSFNENSTTHCGLSRKRMHYICQKGPASL